MARVAALAACLLALAAGAAAAPTPLGPGECTRGRQGCPQCMFQEPAGACPLVPVALEFPIWGNQWTES